MDALGNCAEIKGGKIKGVLLDMFYVVVLYWKKN
jgi:hypothetical protein